MKEINVFAAKTHFSGIITEVLEQHQQFVITKRGQKVAKIIPYETEDKKDVDTVIEAMDVLAKEIGKTGITLDEILEMRDTGRE